MRRHIETDDRVRAVVVRRLVPELERAYISVRGAETRPVLAARGVKVRRKVEILLGFE